MSYNSIFLVNDNRLTTKSGSQKSGGGIPTLKLSYNADFTHEVEIMRKGKMKELKNAIKNFIKEFVPYNINEIDDMKIQSFIDAHNLNIHHLEKLYSEPWTQLKAK